MHKPKINTKKKSTQLWAAQPICATANTKLAERRRGSSQNQPFHLPKPLPPPQSPAASRLLRANVEPEKMFFLSELEHTLRLPPDKLNVPLDVAIKGQLESIFLDKVFSIYLWFFSLYLFLHCLPAFFDARLSIN